MFGAFAFGWLGCWEDSLDRKYNAREQWRHQQQQQRLGRLKPSMESWDQRCLKPGTRTRSNRWWLLNASISCLESRSQSPSPDGRLRTEGQRRWPKGWAQLFMLVNIYGTLECDMKRNQTISLFFSSFCPYSSELSLPSPPGPTVFEKSTHLPLALVVPS